jgi:hypothetical protein
MLPIVFDLFHAIIPPSRAANADQKKWFPSETKTRRAG